MGDAAALGKSRAALCVRLPCVVFSPSTFQPIILQGERALSVIVLKPTQTLMLSLSRLSHRGPEFPQTSRSPFDPSDFVVRHSLFCDSAANQYMFIQLNQEK